MEMYICKFPTIPGTLYIALPFVVNSTLLSLTNPQYFIGSPLFYSETGRVLREYFNVPQSFDTISLHVLPNI